jgi:hypothetical protein
MKMNTRKKGMDVPSIIVIFVIAIVVLLFTLAMIRKAYPGFLSSATCGGRGGICIEKTQGCAIGSHQEIGLSGCTATQICCKSDQPTSTQSLANQLTAKEQDALKNGVIVTLGNNPTPLANRANIPLKVSQPYEFKITVNDGLSSAAAKIGDLCAVYVTDSNDKSRKYTLNGVDGLQEVTTGVSSDEIFDCSPGKIINPAITYIPSSLDAYKSLTLYVILLDKDTSDAYSGRMGPPEEGQTISDFDSMYRNPQNWASWKAFNLDVEPVIKITGLNTAWTAKDDITITCDGISCTKIELGLIKLTGSLTDSETYDHALGRCLGGETDSGGFKSALLYVSGTTVQSSGIPLNIDLGGFRIPYQQRLLYVTDSKPITVVNNKATVTIDKATMIKTFAESNSALLTEDKTYLCVKATQTSAQGAAGQSYYALSETPLKVDALPPVVDVDSGIQVVFPDPITSMNATTPYYYRQYPRIVVSGCYDWGQSGCTNYDYYIKTGNFINLNSNTADWQSGLVGLILTEGVNSLITYFASKDAANTICPLMTSNGYMRNTNPEIRFMGAGQAIVCIRIGDKVGNTRLVWKPIWSPTEMLNRIIVNSLT